MTRSSPSPAPTGATPHPRRHKSASAVEALNGSKAASKVDAAPDAAEPAAQGELLSRAVQGAHQAIDRLADTVAHPLQRVQEGMSAAGDALSQRAGRMRAAGEEWTDSLRDTVRKRPLATLATALALGMLIARVTHR